MQRFAREIEQFDRIDLPTAEYSGEVVERRYQILHGFRDIGLQITSADDALLGVEIYQDKWPLLDRGNAHHDRSFQPEQNGPGSNALERQRGKPHQQSPISCDDLTAASLQCKYTPQYTSREQGIWTNEKVGRTNERPYP
jgi:hypothetical protein